MFKKNAQVCFRCTELTVCYIRPILPVRKWSKAKWCFSPTGFGRKWRVKTIKSNRDETKWCFWLWNSKGFTPISHSYSVFSSYTSGWHEWRQAWKKLTEGGGSMRWHDPGLSASARCVHACVCFSVCVLWIKLGSDICVLCPMPPTSLLLPCWCPRRIPPRPWKVGLHLDKFSSNCPSVKSVTFSQPGCLADW